mgnify:CR=1 FL=1
MRGNLCTAAAVAAASMSGRGGGRATPVLLIADKVLALPLLTAAIHLYRWVLQPVSTHEQCGGTGVCCTAAEVAAPAFGGGGRGVDSPKRWLAEYV